MGTGRDRIASSVLTSSLVNTQGCDGVGIQYKFRTHSFASKTNNIGMESGSVRQLRIHRFTYKKYTPHTVSQFRPHHPRNPTYVHAHTQHWTVIPALRAGEIPINQYLESAWDLGTSTPRHTCLVGSRQHHKENRHTPSQGWGLGGVFSGRCKWWCRNMRREKQEGEGSRISTGAEKMKMHSHAKSWFRRPSQYQYKVRLQKSSWFY